MKAFGAGAATVFLRFTFMFAAVRLLIQEGSQQSWSLLAMRTTSTTYFRTVICLPGLCIVLGAYHESRSPADSQLIVLPEYTGMFKADRGYPLSKANASNF
eukprot:3018783-Amphidinium_carterae.1